jgi:hypothetical protein
MSKNIYIYIYIYIYNIHSERKEPRWLENVKLFEIIRELVIVYISRLHFVEKLLRTDIDNNAMILSPCLHNQS